jgi:hypothetical protein
MSGVPGGGVMMLNSAAREVREVCFVESARSKLVLLPSRSTRACGDKSFARAIVVYKRQAYKDINYGSHLVSGAKMITLENCGTSCSVTAGASSLGERNVSLYPRSVIRKEKKERLFSANFY